ncbi:MAG: DJ-1/PfpI family protein [Candidatus Omnitrophica bacterium]|nr:DJ-1/PfpI family protein [Candidatus Omnitrophota bacterium]MDD5592033.1 DJ-1/PfpI family protein [Candidatus Omnitrophota bacterium]
MKRTLLALLLVVNYGLLAMGYAQERAVDMKKVVMIIPSTEFRDEELIETKNILERNGIEVKVASTTINQIEGMLGAKARPDILLTDIKIGDFSAIIFVGGSGAIQYYDDPLAHKLAQEALTQNKIVAAICIAPVTLARAGILKGRRATVFSSEAGELKSKGANYTARAVEKDGNIITASGPTAVAEFAQELVKALK